MGRLLLVLVSPILLVQALLALTPEPVRHQPTAQELQWSAELERRKAITVECTRRNPHQKIIGGGALLSDGRNPSWSYWQAACEGHPLRPGPLGPPPNLPPPLELP